VLVTVRQDGVQGTWAEESTGWQWKNPWGTISDSWMWIDSCKKVTALTRTTNSALNLFGVGKDKRVYGTWWAPGGKWQDWTVIGHHQADSLVTAVESGQDRVHLFMIGPDRGIYTNYFGLYQNPMFEALKETEMLQDIRKEINAPKYADIIAGRGIDERAESIAPEAPAPSGTPEVPADAPASEVESRGTLTIRPGSPAAQIPSGGPKPVPLPTPTMAPTCKTKDLPCWGAWRRVGDQVAAPGTQVTAVVPRPGHMDVFVVAPDGTIKSAWWEQKSGWSGWFPIGDVKAAPSAQVTAITAGDGRIDLFVVAQQGGSYVEGGIYTASWERNDWQTWGWQPWTRVGDLIAPATSPFTPQISALIPRNSHLDLFVLGSDGGLWSTFREFPARKELGLAASGWNGGKWFPINAWQPVRGSQVVSMLPRDGHIDLFALTGEGVIYNTWWEEQAGWRKGGAVGSNLGKECVQLIPISPPLSPNKAPIGATELTTPQQTIMAQAAGPGTPARITGPNPGITSFLYGILPDGALKWFRHNGVDRKDGPGGVGPNEVGVGWHTFKQVLSSGGNAIYSIAPDGVLRWYGHTGSTEGTFTWTGPKEVGIGWQNFKQVVAGSEGILYAIVPDGKLLWYRHRGFKEGTGLNTPGSWAGPTQVGIGWQVFKHVFGGCQGVLYAIAPDGTLKWYKHNGYQDGTNTWQGPTTVGSGWQNFTQVFGACDGKIYALDPNGTLKLYRHTGFATGQSTWEGPTDVGTGMPSFLAMFALMPAPNTGVR